MTIGNRNKVVVPGDEHSVVVNDSSEGAVVDFRLLGAVEGWSSQQRIDLGPPKQRFVLAVLALKINQLVSVERLVDLTWPHSPPPTAQHAIHVRISRLRATLANRNNDDATIQIITRGSAYVLQADPMCVDTHRFRALVTEARAYTDDTEKVPVYRRALDMWQGPPLADVTTPEVVEQLCAGLEETRLVALEECLDAELRLGKHREAIDELADLVAQHPYRQRLLAQLMLALHRTGRAPEALRAYKVARMRLVEELGLDPDPPLRHLENAILRADPALDLKQRPAPAPVTTAPAVPHQRTAGTTGPFAVETVGLTRRFGKQIALDAIDLAVPPGEIIGLLGPSGAGKTTLIRLLSTVLPPSGGSFAIAGAPSTRPVEIRRRVGVLPAGAGYPKKLTGQEFLAYHARLFGVRRSEAPDLARRLLAEVGLTGHATARIERYSQDMCRRLGVARALVNEPIVVLLDEPTLGLDPEGRHRVLDIVRRIAAERGATVVFSTHHLAEVEQLCRRVLILDKGTPIASGPVGEVTRGLAIAAQ